MKRILIISIIFAFLFCISSGIKLKAADDLNSAGSIPATKNQKRDLPASTDPLLSKEYYLYALNVPQVWDKHNITGRGVTVAFIDYLVELTHPDLASNYDPSLSKDYSNLTGPLPRHGTPIVGILAAANNNVCGIGVAYGSKFSIRNIFSDDVTVEQTIEAFLYKANETPILSNSWGYTETELQFADELKQYYAQPLEQLGKIGRGGLGTIVVFASNVFVTPEGNTNYMVMQSAPQVITVASIGVNYKPIDWSTPGYSVLCSATAQFMSTTDLTGSAGYSSADCTDDISVSGASAPMISGIAAFILEANPKLNWQEVQSILIESSRKIDYASPRWLRNAAGYEYSPDYGFGLPDAERAVSLAKQWKLSKVRDSFNITKSGNVTIPQSGSPNAVIKSTIFVHQRTRVHRARVLLKMEHPQLSDLEITLTSPSGTKSILTEEHGEYKGAGFYIGSTRYDGYAAESSSTYNYNVQAQLIVGNPLDGCTSFVTPSSFVGKIVVLVLNETLCNSTVAIKNAQNANAVGVIVVGSSTVKPDATITIPSLSISQTSLGNVLTRLQVGESITAKLYQVTTKVLRPPNTNLINFPMSTLATYGEKSFGNWVLSVEDKFNDTLQNSVVSPNLISWTLDIFPFDNVMSEDSNNNDDDHNGNHNGDHNNDHNYNHNGDHNNDHNNHNNDHNNDHNNHNNDHNNDHNEHDDENDYDRTLKKVRSLGKNNF